MEKYSWNFDENAEEWRNDPYDTIEECIADAKEYAKSDPDIWCVYIGENVPFVPTVDAEITLDRIADEAYEFCEFAEDWEVYDRKKTEELKELSEQLTTVVNAWLKKYNREPNFWQVQNIKCYSIGGEE